MERVADSTRIARRTNAHAASHSWHYEYQTLATGGRFARSRDVTCVICVDSSMSDGPEPSA